MNSKKLFFIFFSVLSFSSFGQKSKIADANKNYENQAYVDAIATYESVAEKGFKDEGMFLKLGNSYYFNANMEKAAKWYDELFNMNKNQEADVLYRYSQCLKSIGKYKEADLMLVEFNDKSGNDSRAKLFIENRNYLEDINAKSGRFAIKILEFNSKNSDFGGFNLGDSFVFTSERDALAGKDKNEKVSKWTNRAYTNIYSVGLKSDGSFGNVVKPFNSTVNSEFNESTPIFTKDKKTMYFTRNNYLNGKKVLDKENNLLLKLYKASFINGEWKDVKELPFNSDSYSVAHPALSSDDKILYFASDMPGTKGQSDIFRVLINDNGSFSQPENLGDVINTEGRETFPFVAGNNDLFFSSDGRPGLGGLDVYVSKIKGESGFGAVNNVSTPINGPYDDFAIVYDYKTKSGFFSSNRPDGKGGDDIYSFSPSKKPKKCKQSIIGSVTDKLSSANIQNTKLSLFDENFVFIESATSDDNGNYNFDVECGKKYYVRAENEDYASSESPVLTTDKGGMQLVSFELEKRLLELKVGSDLAKILTASSKAKKQRAANGIDPATGKPYVGNSENGVGSGGQSNSVDSSTISADEPDISKILFDTNKSNIRKDQEFQLEKIFVALNDNPTIKIQIRSHTDSRDTAARNLALSGRRAEATKNWLINRGISSNRLSAKGYGESELINGCSDGAKCTQEEHQENRRSEFIIVSIN